MLVALLLLLLAPVASAASSRCHPLAKMSSSD
jgi:hypothetical protein